MLRKGLVYSTSCKQKMKQNLWPSMMQWARYCGQGILAAKGIAVATTIICQDNKSTRVLAENGTTSSGKRTKHFNVLYFLTDKIKNGEVKVAYWTNNMQVDLFAKLLKGTVFVCMREKILNLPRSTSTAVHRVCWTIKIMRWPEARIKWARRTEKE